MSVAVECREVWKEYRSQPVGVKEFLLGKSRLGRVENRYSRSWALEDISFEIEKGRAFAILGHNGAGKSTLLSLMLGTIYPDRGQIVINGKVGSMLELGAGFHPDLTGYENIFLYGSILGLRVREIRSRLPKIVEFSELGEALNNPLRTYSSGMAARLGFSVIANIDADILLIDEVFAVGDARFQEKCRDYLLGFKDAGGTLIIVSHDIGTVSEICDAGVILDFGRRYFYGDIKQLISEYGLLMAQKAK